jgi:hypothetical protein
MPGNYYRDALFIGFSGVAAVVGLESALNWISAQHPAPHRAISAAFGSELAARFPAISSIANAVSHGLMYSALLAAIAGFVALYVKRWALRIPLFLVAAAIRIGDWGSPADFAKQYIFNCFLLGAVIFGIRWLAKLNLLGIFLVIASGSLLSGANTFLGQTNSFYRYNGYVILAALVILFSWPLLKWLSAPSERSA